MFDFVRLIIKFGFSQLALTGGLVLVVKTSVVSAIDKMFVPTPTVFALKHVAMDIRVVNA